MRQITFFYLQGCPYCQQAFRAIRELREQDARYGGIDIREIEETQHPDIVAGYDYYYVPTMFIGREKLYEAKPGESYAECKRSVQTVFEAALQD